MKKTAIVTGAARGIGLATTRLFIAEGWQVAMIDRDAGELDAMAGGLDGASPFVCDVSDSKTVAGMMAAVVAWPRRIDALINNAGAADFGPIEETSFERWRRHGDQSRRGVSVFAGGDPAPEG